MRFSETYGTRHAATIAKLEAERDELVEKVKRAAIDTICTAELPYNRQSCGRDDSGIALTLQRQRRWTLDAVKEAFDTLLGEPK